MPDTGRPLHLEQQGPEGHGDAVTGGQARPGGFLGASLGDQQRAGTHDSASKEAAIQDFQQLYADAKNAGRLPELFDALAAKVRENAEGGSPEQQAAAAYALGELRDMRTDATAQGIKQLYADATQAGIPRSRVTDVIAETAMRNAGDSPARQAEARVIIAEMREIDGQ